MDMSNIDLDRLKSAFISFGCFQAIGHGISSAVLDKVQESAKKFFQLPEEEKQKYSRKIRRGKDVQGLQFLVNGKWVTIPIVLYLLILVIKCRLSLKTSKEAYLSKVAEALNMKFESEVDRLDMSTCRIIVVLDHEKKHTCNQKGRPIRCW